MIEELIGNCPQCNDHSLFVINGEDELKVIDSDTLSIPIICHSCGYEMKIHVKYIGNMHDD